MRKILFPNFQIKIFILFLVIVTMFSGCYNDNVDELNPTIGLFQNCDTTGTISYANDIVPILSSNCGTNNSCHSANNIGGFNLSNYRDLSEQALGGNLVLSITHDPSLLPSKWMPNNCDYCFLNQCSIDKIEVWVNRGFPNN